MAGNPLDSVNFNVYRNAQSARPPVQSSSMQDEVVSVLRSLPPNYPLNHDLMRNVIETAQRNYAVKLKTAQDQSYYDDAHQESLLKQQGLQKELDPNWMTAYQRGDLAVKKYGAEGDRLVDVANADHFKAQGERTRALMPLDVLRANAAVTTQAARARDITAQTGQRVAGGARADALNAARIAGLNASTAGQQVIDAAQARDITSRTEHRNLEVPRTDAGGSGKPPPAPRATPTPKPTPVYEDEMEKAAQEYLDQQVKNGALEVALEDANRNAQGPNFITGPNPESLKWKVSQDFLEEGRKRYQATHPRPGGSESSVQGAPAATQTPAPSGSIQDLLKMRDELNAAKARKQASKGGR